MSVTTTHAHDRWFDLEPTVPLEACREMVWCHAPKFYSAIDSRRGDWLTPLAEQHGQGLISVHQVRQRDGSMAYEARLDLFGMVGRIPDWCWARRQQVYASKGSRHSARDIDVHGKADRNHSSRSQDRHRSRSKNRSRSRSRDRGREEHKSRSKSRDRGRDRGDGVSRDRGEPQNGRSGTCQQARGEDSCHNLEAAPSPNQATARHSNSAPLQPSQPGGSIMLLESSGMVGRYLTLGQKQAPSAPTCKQQGPTMQPAAPELHAPGHLSGAVQSAPLGQQASALLPTVTSLIDQQKQACIQSCAQLHPPQQLQQTIGQDQHAGVRAITKLHTSAAIRVPVTRARPMKPPQGPTHDSGIVQPAQFVHLQTEPRSTWHAPPQA